MNKHERIFRSHYPKATIERQRTGGGQTYYLIRKDGPRSWPVADGATGPGAWAFACEKCGLSEVKQ